jgi:hypothetical protein
MLHGCVPPCRDVYELLALGESKADASQAAREIDCFSPTYEKEAEAESEKRVAAEQEICCGGNLFASKPNSLARCC